MKLTPLLALSLAGCSLYFGEANGPSETDPFFEGGPPGGPPGGPYGGPGGPPGSPGPLPDGSCGAPEVHVIGVYETHSNHSGNNHPPGDGAVRIERPGDHHLVLSAYEPTNWQVLLGDDVKITGVTLIGYHEQTVNLTNVPVTHDTGCGYSFPYNGQGCDTNNLLALAEAHAGAPITSFHGCYHASAWTLRDDGTVLSDCDIDAGYEVNEMFGECDGGGGGGGSGDWEQKDFTTYSPAACTGARYLRFDAQYQLWVGAILCGGADSYKLYLSDAADTPFLEIADYAGHGQDHCELVNPAFTIPDEDDITSGGCASCSTGTFVDLIGVPVYVRAVFGESFERVTSQFWADLTTTVYSCGVSIP